MSHQEQRKFPRADLVFRIRYSADTGSIIGESRDISMGGVSFESRELYPEGKQLKVAFFFEGVLGEIPATGRVVRSWEEDGKPFCAIEFLEIDPNDRVIIEDYVESYFQDKE